MKVHCFKNLGRMGAAIIMVFMFLLLFCVPALAGSSDFEQILLSFTSDTATTQTISWRAPDSFTAGVVQYVEGNGGTSFDSAIQINAVRSELSAGYYHYEVTLTGLKPATQYQYRVGVQDNWSNSYTFATAENNADTFSFMYMGDVQEGYTAWGTMLDEAYSSNDTIAFGLLGGDMVNMGTRADDWASFLADATPVFSRIPMFTTIGNHEISSYNDGKPQLYLRTLALPNNGPLGFEEQFYSFDYGNAHFVVLDSNYMGESMNDTSYAKVQTWLANDLAASTARWKVALFHHPAYPIVSDSHAKPIRENWVPILEAGGVDVVFCGHQHEYMRTKPIADGLVGVDKGIVYIMGNAGSKYYEPGLGQPYIEAEFANTSNYQVVNISGDNLEVICYNSEHEQIDTWQKNKAAEPEPIENLQAGGITVAPYAYVEGYTAITLYNVRFPNGQKQPLFSLSGHDYSLYAAFKDNKNVFRAIIPVAYESFGTNAVAQVLAGLSCTEDEPLTFTYGDIWGSDGKIDVSDVVKACYVIHNGAFSEDNLAYYALDVNGDNNITMEDVEDIINYYLHSNAFGVWVQE